jgi:hypothetical protein
MLEELEAETNPTTNVSISNRILEKNQLLKELSLKIDENIEINTEFKASLDRISLFKMPTPDKVKMFEESFSLLKIQHNEKIEKLNIENLM